MGWFSFIRVDHILWVIFWCVSPYGFHFLNLHSAISWLGIYLLVLMLVLPMPHLYLLTPSLPFTCSVPLHHQVLSLPPPRRCHDTPYFVQLTLFPWSSSILPRCCSSSRALSYASWLSLFTLCHLPSCVIAVPTCSSRAVAC